MHRIAIAVLVAATVVPQSTRAEERDFNYYMTKSYEKLLDPRNGRNNRGYNLESYFTQNLDWGKDRGAIRGKNSPRTMCNAAVTETFIEATNLYAADNPNWSLGSVIPSALWNTDGFTGLKAHFFSHSLFDYPPLEGIPKKEIPDSLKQDIQKFHSEEAMAKAIEKLGIGARVQFREAKEGDIITFDRTNDTNNGGHTYSGHSVTFLGFVDRTQNLTSTYDPAKVVGFKYFSSQGGYDTGGLSERWAYFGGFCPVQTGYSLPSDPKKGGCANRVDNAANRAKFPMEKTGQVTDCCLNQPSDAYGPRVGRIYSPAQWTFAAKYPAMVKEYEALQVRIKEFVNNREKAAIRVALIAKGATALEAKNPSQGTAFISKVKDTFGVDLREVARATNGPAVSPALANRIARLTPQDVISLANRSVTSQAADAFRTRAQDAANDAMAKLRAAEAIGIPNKHLDSDIE